MGREELIVNERKRKLEELRKLGINPYPHRFEVKNYSSEIKERYEKLKINEKAKEKVSVAGRIITIRDLGKLIFATIQDAKGRIQLIFQKGETEKKSFELFKKYFDSGDFIGAEGVVMKTKTGEISVFVKKCEMLAKSILPMPEKWHGLSDKEERYRKRYLDLVMNPGVKEVFRKRAVILEVMRDFMKERGFIEVETPLLQNIYGGAAAKPFKTHSDAYDSDLFLSIAPELYLKKAIVGGLGSVYEITKKFRNEGVDRSHNPEHMTIEWYEEYGDYNTGMKLFEELMKAIVKRIFGKSTFEYQGNKIDVSKWERITLADAIKKYLKEDVNKIKNDDDAKKIAKKHGINASGVTKINIADELMKLFRDKLIHPTFLTDYPIELSPLAKPNRKEPSKAEVFQPFIGGLELARAYSELSDPWLQEEHFNEQEKEREKGNIEAMPTDRDFVTALQHGMPPACGVGIGIERVVMLMTNSTSIRDVILFPFMKPETDKPKEDETMR